MKSRHTTQAGTLLLTSIIAVMLLSACGKKEPGPTTKTSGSLSGVQSTDSLVLATATPTSTRAAALLGIFVSEYLTTAPAAMAAESALRGIGAQMQIIVSQQTVQDPDYDLLQAFGDALQVDVADLLNRSEDRQIALDTYTEALTNVATRANDRYKELSSQLKELKSLASRQRKESAAADKDLKKAIQEKDFDAAGEKQKILTGLQVAYAETDLQYKQIGSLVETLDGLLTLYGKKILAIQQNREVLIVGVKVIDVPGADELRVLERHQANRTENSQSGHDELFQ